MTKLVEAIAKLREDIKSDDLEKIKSSSENLTKLWEPVVTKLYASNASGNSANSASSPFTPEQMAEMMKNAGAANAASNASPSSNDTKHDDGFVDASFSS